MQKALFIIHIILNFLSPILTTEGNNTDIYFTYSGHSETKDNLPIVQRPETGIETDPVPEPTTTETNNEDVVFIPNDKPVFRNEDEYLQNDPVKITDMMNNRRLSDVIGDDPAVTESTSEDILFISGKNNENIEKNDKRNKHEDSIAKTKEKERKRLDCTKLDCDNSVKTVCGGKLDGKQWRYRMFLNECYYRKVNCAFRYANNRYKLVTLDKCYHIGTHSNIRRDIQPIVLLPISKIEETRRIFSSRRSLNTDINGQDCSHPCPLTCTEKYEPQCAVSNTGHYHTFLNHCKLDYNSCLYKVVWHIQPLSECVGGKKADVQQNRGFIAWMQKVGIVDNRGRLTLSKKPRSG